jgi:hypothetical protein
LLAFAALVGALGAGAWSYRTPALTWYCLRGLTAADEEARGPWVSRVVALDWAAVPGLLVRLEGKDPTVCNNIEAALVALAKQWGPEDPRTQELADEIRERFLGLSTLGQISVLHVITATLRRDGPPTWPVALTRAAADLVAATRDRPELRVAALALAGALLDRAPSGQWVEGCRALADKGLGDDLPKARLAAVQLAMRPALQGDHALLTRVVPMLRDKAALTRRAALVALAPARDLVTEDELLPLLHDDDVEVQHLCVAALRSRGLTDDHLELARLISDPSPRARLKVLERLSHAEDLDTTAWLRRLSQDPSAAVRAAAARAAARYPQADLGDRLRDMARNDPSETVRQNALYYLQLRSTGASD